METFPLQEFCSKFREFSDQTKFPLSAIQNAADKAIFHVGHDVEGMPMQGPYRWYAVFLMTAHLLALDANDDNSESGTSGIGGMPFKATIGSVSIENTKPNSFTSDSWDFWLSQTKYGRELLAYYDVQAPAGIYISPESVRDLA